MAKVARFTITVAALAALTACASKPAPPPLASSPPPPVAAVQKPQAPVVPRGPVPGSLEDFRVSVGERVFFDLDQSTLTSAARGTLDRQAAWLRTYPSVRVLIEGNADERGTREYNIALGARRAAAVKDYLVSLGVAGNRIDSVSYGKERPMDPRSTEEAWALNRNARTGIVSGAVS
jgi:peptidoglycan-associated lipoprotein